MKIVNLSYNYFPHKDPDSWIRDFGFFYGIWECLATSHEIIFMEFIDHEGTYRRAGVEYRFLRKNALGLFIPFRLHRTIRKLRPDVVMVHGLMFPLQVLLLRMQLGGSVKIVMQHHAERPFHNWMKVAVQRMADRCVDAYFFTGRAHTLPWMKADLIRDAGKVREIMEASSAFVPMDRDEARVKAGMSATTTYLWVGHLNANKNPLMVVRAFLWFAAQQDSVALYLVFQSDELLPEINTLLATQPALAARIHLVGKVEHAALPAWFSAADFLISGSYYEGSGVAACEAMACGCIPILTDIPSFRFMTGGTCGMLYAPGDDDALQASLIRSMTLDREAARQKTLQRFYQELSFKAIAGRIQEELSGL